MELAFGRMGALLSRTPSSTYLISASGTGISSVHTALSVMLTGGDGYLSQSFCEVAVVWQ